MDIRTFKLDGTGESFEIQFVRVYLTLSPRHFKVRGIVNGEVEVAVKLSDEKLYTSYLVYYRGHEPVSSDECYGYIHFMDLCFRALESHYRSLC